MQSFFYHHCGHLVNASNFSLLQKIRVVEALARLVVVFRSIEDQVGLSIVQNEIIEVRGVTMGKNYDVFHITVYTIRFLLHIMTVVFHGIGMYLVLCLHKKNRSKNVHLFILNISACVIGKISYKSFKVDSTSVAPLFI